MVIDLDETLVHSSFKVSKFKSGFFCDLNLSVNVAGTVKLLNTLTGLTGSPRMPGSSHHYSYDYSA